MYSIVFLKPIFNARFTLQQQLSYAPVCFLPKSSLIDMFTMCVYSQCLPLSFCPSIPHSIRSNHSCFFNVELPRFSSERVLRERLLYAMQTTTMNADEMPAS